MRSILISSHLPCILQVVCSLHFSLRKPCMHFFTHIYATWFALFTLHSITLTICDEQQKSCRSLVFNFLHIPLTSSLSSSPPHFVLTAFFNRSAFPPCWRSFIITLVKTSLENDELAAVWNHDSFLRWTNKLAYGAFLRHFQTRQFFGNYVFFISTTTVCSMMQ